MKRAFRNDSIEYIYIYTVMVIPDCVPEKVAYLKGRALSCFNPTILFIVVGHCVLTASTISK